jgi:hypothetical protein
LNIAINQARFGEAKLYSATGQLVLCQQIVTPTATLDVSALRKGIYLLELSGDTDRFTKTIVID